MDYCITNYVFKSKDKKALRKFKEELDSIIKFDYANSIDKNDGELSKLADFYGKGQSDLDCRGEVTEISPIATKTGDTFFAVREYSAYTPKVELWGLAMKKHPKITAVLLSVCEEGELFINTDEKFKFFKEDKVIDFSSEVDDEEFAWDNIYHYQTFERSDKKGIVDYKNTALENDPETTFTTYKFKGSEVFKEDAMKNENIKTFFRGYSFGSNL